MNSYQRLYTSIVFSREKLSIILDSLRKLSEASMLIAARYAVSYGDFVQTPYFPATATKNEGTSLSLLYPSLFASLTEEELQETFRELSQTAQEIFNDFLGIDFSLSPWGDESVAKVVENVSGTVFGAPGTILAIRQINSQIKRLAERINSLGYNEVMLPLAEDNRLKELARVGQLKFSHLLTLSTFCVAGLDMVLLPDSTENKLIEDILIDLSEIQAIKGKPLGLRLILAPGDEGEEIDLDFFGKTPIISPLQ